MIPKIALYGFGTAPPVFRHAIETARAAGLSYAWCLILPQPHFRGLLRDYIPDRDTLDLFEALPRTPQGGEPGDFTAYAGNVFEDLAATKRQWRHRRGPYLFARGHDCYRLYKAFLRDRGATHVLLLSVETPDAKILIAAARELGLGVMVASDLRTLTGTMFTCDALETPPPYARASTATRLEAQAFIKAFRAEWRPARGQPLEIDPKADDRTQLPSFIPPFGQRLVGFAKTWAERPDLFDPVYIRDSIMSGSKGLRRLIWGTRTRLNEGKYDVGDPAALPRKFIFYPLHYTPESSINTPSPYFVDQLRVIDAIRFAMPSECTLVVKEHWSCLQLRPLSFIPHLRTLPGVCVAKFSMPARALIERAAVTVSVTGTAVLEAALGGYPAIALGGSVSSWVAGGITPLGNLSSEIKGRIESPTADIDIVDRVAELFDARYPFFQGSPGMAGEPMLRQGNITRFVAALDDHVRRSGRTMAADSRMGR